MILSIQRIRNRIKILAETIGQDFQSETRNIMNNQYISSILAITSLAFSKAIDSDCAFAKSSCASFADHARDICMAIAKKHEKIAKTQLDVCYQSAKEAGYAIAAAKVRADDDVAHENFDAITDDARDPVVNKT